jgi:RNA polymerase sigma factor (sigma-70 family)
MPRTATESLVRSLGSLFEGGSVAGLSDRQLLERFTAAREAAFAGLVARHGPMVLGLCHHLLGDLHHAEDAFQAVFLVLARRACTIRDPDLLANWLYGVALRMACCAKAQLDCRRRKEQAGTLRPPGPGSSALLEPMVQPVEQPLIDGEQAEALHSEISRLPASFRLPVLLCYFEGLTLDEAARRLSCPAGTLRSRLARGRDKLRRALTRRGVTLSVATLAAALSPRFASASISSRLCETTARAAIQFAVGQTAAPLAADLAKDVLKSMLANKLRLTVLTVLLVGTVATGAGYFVQALAKNDELKSLAADRESRAAAHPDDGILPKTRMFVAGRVLDPAGKEMAGVSIEIVGRPRGPVLWAAVDGERHRLLGRGVSTAGGRFSFEASRTSAHRFFEVYALAAAPGFGLGWSQLNADADEPTVEIRLQPEQIIHGKLFDVNGQPAPMLELQIGSIGRPTNVGMFDGVNLGSARPEGLPYLPITQRFACAKGTVKTTQDVKLPRGLLIHGRVIEHGSRRHPDREAGTVTDPAKSPFIPFSGGPGKKLGQQRRHSGSI